MGTKLGEENAWMSTQKYPPSKIFATINQIMIGQKSLGSEFNTWIELGVTIGKNRGILDQYIREFSKFLREFTPQEISFVSTILGKTININNLSTSDKTDVRLLLLKKFIDKNNLLTLAEFFDSKAEGIELEKEVFLKLLEKLFKKGYFPFDVYAYCVFREKGSPTTWFKINNNATEEEIRNILDVSANRLCNRLTRRLRRKRKLRIKQETGKFLIYLITRPIGENVVLGEIHNQETQRAAYSLLVFNKEEKKIGFISNYKNEIMEAQKFIKEVIFPGQIFIPRNDIKLSNKELLKKLLFAGDEEDALDIVRLELKKVNLTNSPSLKLETKDEKPLNAAIGEITQLWKNLGISDIKEIVYRFKDKRIKIYSYGDDWSRSYLNVFSRGKTKEIEDAFIEKLKLIIGVEIKEVSFLVEDLNLEFILSKLLKDKFIRTSISIPEDVEKVIVELVGKRLIKEPKTIAKRKCIDYTCTGLSWTDWLCPRCGRSMAVFGEGITIELNQSQLLKHIHEFGQQNLTDYALKIQTIQRRKTKKKVIYVFSKEKNIGLFMVPIFNKKDLSFCKALSKEGYGIIAIYDPNFSNQKVELENLGATAIPLDLLFVEMKKTIDKEESSLVTILNKGIEDQEKSMLSLLYKRLHDSAGNMLNKTSNYNEDDFEIDIKNILQALVPNVVRLGTKFKGKSVPDGYCSYGLSDASRQYLFGWDAKFSISSDYRLKNKDFIKQKNYMIWLAKNNEPRSLGKLRIYSIISNFNQLQGFIKVLTNLRNSTERPWGCKIILIQDLIISKLASWILSNWDKVIENGPKISEVFFNWITKHRRTKNHWIYCTNEDWASLEELLNRI